MAEFDPNVRSFFDSFSSAVAQDLMTLQLTAGQPEPTNGISVVSDPIVPDRLIRERLSHFDPEIYDLRDESHLMKLIKVLLGAAGVGGLRKQLTVARLQNGFKGMHFLDLDRFYGALFGIRRTQGEVYPKPDFDPYTGVLAPEEWDDVHARDASYRDRIAKFAKTIPMGATYSGMKAMAEAMLSVECEIIESWSEVDDYLASQIRLPNLVYTYEFLGKSVNSFADLEGSSWENWGGGGAITIGRTGHNTRSDFTIQPKKTISPAEAYEVQRVLDTFKPAGTQFVVDPDGLAIHQPARIRNVAASSEYWEVVQKLTVNEALYLGGYGIIEDGIPYQEVRGDRNQPRPAFSQYSGEEMFYNGNVMYVMASRIDEDGLEYMNNQELVVFNDGVKQTFRASDALLSPARAEAGRLASDGVLAAAPYAVSRSVGSNA